MIWLPISLLNGEHRITKSSSDIMIIALKRWFLNLVIKPIHLIFLIMPVKYGIGVGLFN